MKFSTEARIAMTHDRVRACLKDPLRLQAIIEARGLTLSPERPRGADELAAWTSAVEIKGKVRPARLALCARGPDEPIWLDAESGGLSAKTVIVIAPDAPLAPDSSDITRLDVVTEVTSTTLSGKLLLQPLKLARAALEERYRDHVARIAAELASAPKPS